jgi:Tol biopolymer transport system component
MASPTAKSPGGPGPDAGWDGSNAEERADPGIACCRRWLDPGVAAPPGGPRLAVMGVKDNFQELEIATLGPSGGGYRRVEIQRRSKGVGAPGGLAWSPDGSLLAYSRRQRNGRRAIVVVQATGRGRPRVVPGTRGGEWPVFSPDGRSMAFARYRAEGAGENRVPTFESASVWIVDLESGARRQLTRWRNHLWQYPASFSPDGSTLLLDRVDYRRSVEDEIVALRFDGRTSGLLVGEGEEPLYSPDGRKIVFVDWRERRVWSSKRRRWVFRPTSDLSVVDADGTHRRRLTRTSPGRIEMLGSWDPSSQRIAYIQFRGFPFRRGSTGAVMEVNADGSCPHEIFSVAGVDYFSPVWQPRPGREAGRIHC